MSTFAMLEQENGILNMYFKRLELATALLYILCGVWELLAKGI